MIWVCSEATFFRFVFDFSESTKWIAINRNTKQWIIIIEIFHSKMFFFLILNQLDLDRKKSKWKDNSPISTSSIVIVIWAEKNLAIIIISSCAHRTNKMNEEKKFCKQNGNIRQTNMKRIEWKMNEWMNEQKMWIVRSLMYLANDFPTKISFFHI